jgi:hypothetical protein
MTHGPAYGIKWESFSESRGCIADFGNLESIDPGSRPRGSTMLRGLMFGKFSADAFLCLVRKLPGGRQGQGFRSVGIGKSLHRQAMVLARLKILVP